MEPQNRHQHQGLGVAEGAWKFVPSIWRKCVQVPWPEAFSAQLQVRGPGAHRADFMGGTGDSASGREPAPTQLWVGEKIAPKTLPLTIMAQGAYASQNFPSACCMKVKGGIKLIKT